MSNLDNLVSKIMTDCENKAKQILEEADKKAAEIMQENISIANKEKDKILADAKTEAEKSAEQIVLGKKLEIRDNNLNAKQQVIDKVFAHALEKMNSMSKDDFFKFLSSALVNMELDGEELMLPKKYKVTSIDELNAYLKDNGKKGNLKLYSGPRDIDGGFTLIKGGIENNNTFDSLIDYYRYELEGKIIESLF